MKSKIKILGAGLICVDVVHTNTGIQVMSGGSCANVISVLSQIGFNCSIMREKHSDSFNLFLTDTFSALGVNEVFYKHSNSATPRIVEELTQDNHKFFTKCPFCGEKILNLRLPSESDLKHVINEVKEFDVFYSDRTSSGIRQIMRVMNEQNGIVVYEPNSSRNVKGLFETAQYADIIKFSNDRVSVSLAEKIRTDNKRIKLIISTNGANGLSFSYRKPNGEMSNWIAIPSTFRESVVDSSGAGDWLTAGFLSELLKERCSILEQLCEEEQIIKMLEHAMRYSQLCCSVIGAQGIFYSSTYAKEFKELSKNENYCELQSNNTFARQKSTCSFCLANIC